MSVVFVWRTSEEDALVDELEGEWVPWCDTHDVVWSKADAGCVRNDRRVFRVSR